MNNIMNVVNQCIIQNIPCKIYKKYFNPLVHIANRKQPYDAELFFNSYWKMAECFDDRCTINQHQPELHAKFHYNLVENNIIQFLIDHNYDVSGFNVLDIGSGTGHWLNFWKDFSTNSITGIDISKIACDNLQKKFSMYKNIEIAHKDISSKNFCLDKKFDVINAIGVMFHIVDDELWKRSVNNLCNYLKCGGIGFIGGNFGIFSNDNQFHCVDDLKTCDGSHDNKWSLFGDIRVNKRLRSKMAWKKALKENNCKILKVKIAKVPHNINTPQNNLLIFCKD